MGHGKKKMPEGGGHFRERKDFWGGGLFCSVLFLNKLLSVLNDTMPQEVQVLFFRKMPRLRAITTGLLRHPKWAKNTCLKEYLQYFPWKVEGGRRRGKREELWGEKYECRCSKQGADATWKWVLASQTPPVLCCFGEIQPLNPSRTLRISLYFCDDISSNKLLYSSAHSNCLFERFWYQLGILKVT